MSRSVAQAGVALAVGFAALILVGSRASAPGGTAGGALPEPVWKDGRVATGPDTAVFAGGCFWGVEAVFEHLKGVRSAVSGYAGGTYANPSYEHVSTGYTGHEESVLVIYDPAEISYATLLRVFFSVAHDPTQRDRQGPDVGSQYRSAIFYADGAQKQAAEAYIRQLTEIQAFSRPIVTQIAPLEAFYRAEDYHQDYMVQHPNQPYIVIHDRPKLARLERQFPQLYRERR